VRFRVVLDTNVIVAGMRSRRGASNRLLQLVGTGRFDTVVSVPLLFEYEDALSRSKTGLSERDRQTVLDYLCQASLKQRIFFLWRPLLPDPGDDMVLEAAVAGECDGIVTFNTRDFGPAADFGVDLWSPAELLLKIGDIG